MAKIKYNNGKRHTHVTRQEANQLRRNGWTHRELAKHLGISCGSAALWTKGISISEKQKTAIYKRRAGLSPNGRQVLVDFARTKLRQFHFQTRYTREDLLEKIRKFHQENGRIPLKREFNSYRIFLKYFGSWNDAIEAAGFQPNKVIFSKRLIARDGHTCDSFGEMIVDNYLSEKNIPHQRNAAYPNHSKLKVDFVVEGIFIEYFGLAGEVPSYDEYLQRKRRICRQHNIRLVEVYPRDIFDRGKYKKFDQLMRAIFLEVSNDAFRCFER